MTSRQAGARVVTIVDLQIQNILSVENALRVVGAQVNVVREAASIASADLLVLPGVGSFRAAAERLHSSGMAEAIKQHAIASKRPVVGLCLGMQLLSDFSDEHGVHSGLGLIPGKVARLEEAPPEYRVPNVGWREVSLNEKAMELLPKELNNRSYYHVHSYHFQTTDPSHTIGTSKYGSTRIASIVQRGSIVGTQFHPEKSQESGLDLLHALITGLR
jgi:glutamine amidotransferase